MRSIKIKALLPLIFGLILPWSASAQSSQIIYVSKAATGSANGTSWANAYTDLPQALNAASALTGTKEIWVAKAEYRPSGLLDRSASFVIPANTILYGGFIGNESTVSARDWRKNRTILTGDLGVWFDYSDNSYHVVRFSDVGITSILDGFIVKGGNADVTGSNNDSGGGILITSSTVATLPIVRNCEIVENKASEYGGGIAVVQSTQTCSPQFVNCQINGNESNKGGGLAMRKTSGVMAPQFVNCSFSTNKAWYGGAIFNGGSTASFVNNTIVKNQASLSNAGGAVYIQSGILKIDNSILWENFILNISDGLVQYNQISSPSPVVKNSIIQGGYGTASDNNLDQNPLFKRPPSFEGKFPRTSIWPYAYTQANVEGQRTVSGSKIASHAYYAFNDKEYGKIYTVGNSLQVIDYRNTVNNTPVSTIYPDFSWGRIQRIEESVHRMANKIYLCSYSTGVKVLDRATGEMTSFDVMAGTGVTYTDARAEDLVVDDENNLLYAPVFYNPGNTFYGLLEYDLTAHTKRWINYTSSPISLPTVAAASESQYWNGHRIYLDHKDNTLYYSMGNGVWWWNRTNNTTGIYSMAGGMSLTAGSPNLPSNLTTGVYMDHQENKLYIGTHAGLFVWNKNTNTSRVYNTSNSSMAHNQVNHVDKNEKDGLVYIALEMGGLFVIDTKNAEERMLTKASDIDVSPGLPESYISSAHFDESDNKLYTSWWYPGGGIWVSDYNDLVPDYGDLRVISASPAIDKGNAAVFPAGLTNDLGGINRFIDLLSGSSGDLDIGAYESPGNTDGIGNALPGIPGLDDMNYISVVTPLHPGSNELPSSEFSPEMFTKTTQFFDGLGRPIQTVSVQASPSKKDLVVPIKYDEFGREAKKYLPYTSGSNGAYKEDVLDEAQYKNSRQYNFYQYDNLVAGDVAPYSVTNFEPSPLNRVAKEGAPGADWQPDAVNSYSSTDHSTKMNYGTNVANEVFLFSYTYPTSANTLGSIVLSPQGFYTAGQLYKNSVKDEHLKEKIEYKDKEGKVILRKVQATTTTYAQTYYIYDDFNNLVGVIQPEAVNTLVTKVTSPILASMVGVSVGTGPNLNTITKTASNGYGNAGCVSSETLPAGEDGWVEMRAEETNKSRMIGLAATNVNTGTSIQYALELNSNGKIYVWENGVQGTDLGLYTTGAIVRVSREANMVKYYVDNLLKATSSTSSTGSLMADVALNENGSTIKGLRLSFAASAAIGNYSFRYTYDSRKRMTQKLVPGASLVYMVYDDRDRLVFTQDGEQRKGSNRYWSFTKYDVLDRPVLSGIYTADLVLSQGDMQTRVNDYYSNLGTNGGAWFETYNPTSATHVHGYDNKSYPSENNLQNFLSIQYYDDYSFASEWGTRYNYVNDGLTEIVNGVKYSQTQTMSKFINGKVTGAKIKVLDGGIVGGYTWLKTVNYYDDKSQLTQQIADNYKGGENRTSTLYDFTGKVLETKTTYVDRDFIWQDQVGTQVVGNIIKRIGTSTSGAGSKQQLAAGLSGWMEFTVSELNTTRVVGLNDSNPDVAGSNINYGFNLLSTGTVNVFENNSPKYTLANVKAGDVLRIERNGSTVTYYHNGFFQYTSATASSTALLVDISLTSSNATIVGVRTSFTESSRQVKRRFKYDHAGRLMNTWHQIDNQNDRPLSFNEYNELGQLVDKKLESENPSTFLQSIDYRYNIRGWLIKINESNLADNTDDATLDAWYSHDLFGMEIGYSRDIGINNEAQYNGNVSGIKWGSVSDVWSEKSYVYSYDAMNRLTDATFKKKAPTWTTPSGNSFSETGYSYDLNGNILSLKRYDERGAGTALDNLVYTYSGTNRLLKIADSGDDYAGFVDGTNTGNDYSYDNNGNMVTDQNKGITTAMTYNVLNLPEWIQKGGNSTRIIYDASGRKLSQTVTQGSSAQQSDYVGDLFFENDILQFINHDEGRVVVVRNTLLYTNACETTTGITPLNVTLAAITDNGNEKYVRATSNGVAGGGIFQMASLSNVIPGWRYLIRIKAYREKGTASSSNPAYLMLKSNGVVFNSPGAIVPERGANAIAEYWVEQEVTMPAGGTQLEIGVGWSTVTAGEILSVNEIEVFLLESGLSSEYQYTLKDNLGNNRVTFTSAMEIDLSVATLEDWNEETESSQFLYYDEAIKVNHALWNHTDENTSDLTTEYATRLTGGNTNAKYGLAKSLSVMTGDMINIEVYAKYLDTNQNNWTAALQTLMMSIAQGTAAPGTIVDGGSAGSIGSSVLPIVPLNHDTENGVPPKAYLNYILFDKTMTTVLDFGFKRISAAAKESGQNVKHDRLYFERIIIKEPGYLYTYISNENPTAVEVYFDDFKVEQFKTPVIHTADYYPFGLAFNSYQRENTIKQDFLYNSKELCDEMNLGWLDYGARMYMPEIARWGAIDPLAEKYLDVSPYNYTVNNPLRFIDPDGRKIVENENSTNYTGDDAQRYFWYLKMQDAASKTYERMTAALMNGEGVHGYSNAAADIKSSNGSNNQSTKVGAQQGRQAEFTEFVKFFYGDELKRLDATDKIKWRIFDAEIDLAGEVGRTKREDDGTILIRIGVKAMLDPKLLYHTVGHELIHASDYLNGNFDKWNTAIGDDYQWYGTKRVMNLIMEYHAYTWDAATEVKFGTDYGAKSELEYVTSELNDLSLQWILNK